MKYKRTKKDCNTTQTRLDVQAWLDKKVKKHARLAEKEREE